MSDERFLSSLAEFIATAAEHINGKLGDSVKDWLPEQIKTTKNLAEVALLLIEFNRRDLLPTILELMYEHAQGIIDENCVVRDDKD